MYGVHATDLTGDGADEILMGGNLYDVKPQAGPYDASRGIVVDYRNDHLGTWPADISVFEIDGEIRGIKPVIRNGDPYFIISRYNDEILIRSVNGN
jgi:hypothetical protein